MYDGTRYSVGKYETKEFHNISLNSTAFADIESALPSNIFSLGLIGWYTGSGDVRLIAKDFSGTKFRPKMIIVYGVNGTTANDAIVEGILHALPGNLIHSNQQIYLVNNAGQHYTGRFDKATVKNNQTWALNYRLPSESLIGMPSLFKVLNVWENQSLTYAQVKLQVETFINGTKI